MTSSQFSEWLAFSAIEPIGRENRNELRHGQLMQVVDKIWLTTANLKRNHDMLPIDFMNYQEKPEAKTIDLSDEQTQAQIDKDVFGM